MKLLRAVVRRTVPDEEARAVYRLTLTHKDWRDAHEEVLREIVDEIKAQERKNS